MASPAPASPPPPMFAIADIGGNQALDAFYLLIMGVFVFFMQVRGALRARAERQSVADQLTSRSPSQCGFALLEAGTVRSKNTKNILLKNLLDACLGAFCPPPRPNASRAFSPLPPTHARDRPSQAPSSGGRGAWAPRTESRPNRMETSSLARRQTAAARFSRPAGLRAVLTRQMAPSSPSGSSSESSLRAVAPAATAQSHSPLASQRRPLTAPLAPGMSSRRLRPPLSRGRSASAPRSAPISPTPASSRASSTPSLCTGSGATTAAG